MKPLTHFKKTKILRNIFLSLGAIFALAVTAHAQNLYVSCSTAPGSHAILEFTPSGTQSTYASGLLITLEAWPLTASAIFSRRITLEPDNHDDWESAEI